MNKLEIERAISKECKELLLELKANNEKFDGKGIEKFQKRLWQIADKYGTDGANVFNIMMKNYNDINGDIKDA
ncbi:MAG: hypothetical protein ACERLG_02350 [Sedimentibacter sp.]